MSSEVIASWLDRVRDCGALLATAPQHVLANKEVVLAAVTQDGSALQFAAPALKADLEIVLAAVQQDGRCLKNASEACKKDKDVVLAAVRNTVYALQYSKPEALDTEVLEAADRQCFNRRVDQFGASGWVRNVPRTEFVEGYFGGPY